MLRYQLGVEYFHGRRVEAATEELNKALEADPQNADAYNMLGLIALQQGHDYVMQAETQSCLKGADREAVRTDAARKFHDAESKLKRAVELRPAFADAWNNLSVAALQLRNWDLAVESAASALKDPTYADPALARANLGWAYFQKKDLQQAWKELHEAVSRAPNFCVGRYRLAKGYMERGDVEQAAEEVDAVVADKRCPIQEAFLLAGLVAERHKDSERSRTLFQRCSEMAPRSCIADECRRYAQMVH